MLIPDWKNWSPKLCAQMDDLCEPAMKDFGYGQEPLWKEKVQIGQKSNDTYSKDNGLV